jgi:hypothetical protein
MQTFVSTERCEPASKQDCRGNTTDSTVFQVTESSNPVMFLWQVMCAFLDAFAELREGATGVVMSVQPLRKEQLGRHWSDFHYVRYMRIFRKSVEKAEVSLNSDKNIDTLYKDLWTFMILSHSILLTPWSTIFPEKLTRLKLLKEFPGFHSIKPQCSSPYS